MGIIARFLEPFRHRQNVSLVRTSGSESARDREIKEAAAADVAEVEQDDKYFGPDEPADEDELLSVSPPCSRAVNGTCVLVNGKIVTVDDQFSVRQAVAIDGERVAAVGSDAAILAQAGPQATVIDLGGKTVIPGLIDNHNHFVRATEHVEVRLEGVRTRAAAPPCSGPGSGC